MSKDYPIEDDSSPATTRIKSFFEQHRRSVSLVGALIVFFTFVIKEAIREQVKDTVASLQSAEDVFVVRGQNELTLDLLNAIQTHVDIIWNTTPDRANYLKQHERASLDDDLTSVRELILQAEGNLDNLRRLIEKVSEKDISLQHSLDDVERQYRSVKESETNLIAGLQNKTVNEDDEDGWVDSLGSDSEDLLVAISDLSTKAADRSDEIRKKEEAKYRRYTSISYLLYAIGWSLALFGRLYGLESITDEA